MRDFDSVNRLLVLVKFTTLVERAGLDCGYVKILNSNPEHPQGGYYLTWHGTLWDDFYFNHLETVDLPTFKRSAIFLHDKPSPLSFFACSRLSVLSPHLRCTLSL